MERNDNNMEVYWAGDGDGLVGGSLVGFRLSIMVSPWNMDLKFPCETGPRLERDVEHERDQEYREAVVVPVSNAQRAPTNPLDDGHQDVAPSGQASNRLMIARLMSNTKLGRADVAFNCAASIARMPGAQIFDADTRFMGGRARSTC
jgi:hypothetical protein